MEDTISDGQNRAVPSNLGTADQVTVTQYPENLVGKVTNLLPTFVPDKD